MIQEGSVFVLRSSEHLPHYHIVIFRDPLNRESANIVLYLTSTETKPDRTCEFNRGDDFFISKYSCVKYRNCKVIFDIDLEPLECIGVASDKTMRKIKTGFDHALQQGKIVDDAKDLFFKWKDDLLYSKMND